MRPLSILVCLQDEDDNEESMFKDDKKGKKVEDKKKSKEGDIFSSFLDEGDDEGGLFGSAEDVSTLETAASLHLEVMISLLHNFSLFWFVRAPKRKGQIQRRVARKLVPRSPTRQGTSLLAFWMGMTMTHLMASLEILVRFWSRYPIMIDLLILPYFQIGVKKQKGASNKAAVPSFLGDDDDNAVSPSKSKSEKGVEKKSSGGLFGSDDEESLGMQQFVKKSISPSIRFRCSKRIF